MLRNLISSILIVLLSATSVLARGSYQDFEVKTTTPQITLFDDTTNSVVAWWEYNPSGGITTISALANKPGGPGNALRFNAANEIVTVNDDDSLDLGGVNWWMSVWINPTSIDTSGSTDILLEKGANQAYTLRQVDAVITFRYYNSAVNDLYIAASGAVLTAGEWQNIIITWDGATLTIYRNTVSVATDSGGSPSGSFDETQPLYIGKRVDGFEYSGKIDELAIWKGSNPSANDRSDVYKAGVGLRLDKDEVFQTDGTPIGDNLSALWHCDEPSGATVTDSSDNTNTGTLANGDRVDGKILQAGSDNKVVALTVKDGIDDSQSSVVEVGDSSNPGEIIYVGDEHTWNLNGTTVMYFDRDTKTLVIDNGEAGSSALKLIGAAGQSEYLLTLQDSSLADAFLLGVAGGKLAANAGGEVTLFEDVGSGDNANTKFKQFGYNTADTSAKYIQWWLNDTTDWLELSREDAFVLGLDVQIPLKLSSLTEGSIPYIGAAGVVSEANDVLLYSATHETLAVGETGSEITVPINGVTYKSHLRVSDLGDTHLAQALLHRHSNSGAIGATLVGVRARGATASHTVVQDNDNLFDIIAAGWGGSDYSISSGIFMEVDGTPGDGDMPGRITFLTTPDGSEILVSAVTIDSGQNTKIGDGGTSDYTNISSVGGVTYIGTSSGVPYGEIYANDAGEDVVINTAGEANKKQVTAFDTDGVSNNMTPDHTNDHITITVAGVYFCSVSIHIDSQAGVAATFGFALYKNNGATQFANVHGHRDLPAGVGGNSGAMSLSGLIDLAVNDTIEVWVWNEDNTQDVTVDDITLSLMMQGGT
jgi:hypothetical protein